MPITRQTKQGLPKRTNKHNTSVSVKTSPEQQNTSLPTSQTNTKSPSPSNSAIGTDKTKGNVKPTQESEHKAGSVNNLANVNTIIPKAAPLATYVCALQQTLP